MKPRACCFSCDRLYKFDKIVPDYVGFHLIFKQIRGTKEDYLYEDNLKIYKDGRMEHPEYICVGPTWKIIENNVPEPPRNCLKQLEWWVLEERESIKKLTPFLSQ